MLQDTQLPDLCLSGHWDDDMGELGELDLNAALAQSVKMNHRNESLTVPLSEGAAGKQPKLAMMMGRFWQPGSELNIAFLSGTSWQQNKVKQYASLWTKYANLKFNFIQDSSATPDILIDFDPNGGSWSALGTRSASLASQGKPSMNFGWVNPTRNESEMRRTILHEFGHALGATHEHSSPRSKIPWNTEAVYSYYSRPPNNWSREKIDFSVMRKLSLDEVQASEYDPDSIMLYYYPPELTLDGSGTKRNVDLSDKDKEYIRFCYPPSRNTVGLFNTLEVSPSDNEGKVYTREELYYQDHAEQPQLILGLNCLDMEAGRNIRVHSQVLLQKPKSFEVKLSTWGDSVLNTGGLTWLEIGQDLGKIVSFGTVHLYASMSYIPGKQQGVVRNVTFKTPFKAPPRVICMIQSLDLDGKKDWSFRTYATGVSNSGCRIHVEAGPTTVMYSARVAWLAFPQDDPSMGGGRFTTADLPSAPTVDNSRVVGYGRVFKEMPKVFMALDEFDYSCQKNLRVRVGTSKVSRSALTLHLQSWGDSRMRKAGASYFAWCPPAEEQPRGLTFV